jgi:hypothetical protein
MSWQIGPKVALATIDLVVNIEGSDTSRNKPHDKHLLEHLIVE